MANDIQYIDDEIDLMPYVRYVASNWRRIFVCIIFGCFIGLCLVFFLPKKFRANVTFIMPNHGSVLSSNTFFDSFIASAVTTGGGSSGVYSGYIEPIFNSNRIKRYVARQLINEVEFLSSLGQDGMSIDDHVIKVIDYLSLSEKSLTLTKDEGIYIISYSNHDPNMILPVLNAYLNALKNMNDELNIDSEVLQIIPLDEAVIPRTHYFPNLIQFIVLGGVLAGSITVIWLLIEFVLRNKLNGSTN